MNTVMTYVLTMVIFVAMIATLYAAINYSRVKVVAEGTSVMSEIAYQIRMGANTFLFSEYKVLAVVVVCLTLLQAVFIFPASGAAFFIGIIMSGIPGFWGMKSSTYANVRVTNTALQTKNLGKTLQFAFMGGTVMGLPVGSFSLFGLALVFLLFHSYTLEINSITNWCNMSFVPIAMILSSYSLGCSTIALFSRVGGGIYTKAADMGADLVGKGEEKIPEDDPRNPGVIADCVGDNVGDTAGLGSDLLESNVGSIVSAIITIMFTFKGYQARGLHFSQQLYEKLMLYPIAFATLGLLACMIGAKYLLSKKDCSEPHHSLNMATWISAGLTAIFNLILTVVLLGNEDLGDLAFRFGIVSPWCAAFIGIISGIMIGLVAEYYTSYDYSPTKQVAAATKEGPAPVITQGWAISFKSVLMCCGILAVALVVSYIFADFYGISMAAVGMLSFVSMTVSVDTYGPISDNAGGIAEMAHLGADVRAITDTLDSVGNTTAAIGKGFAIGSAALATVSLLISYMYSFTPIESSISLNIMNPLVFAGLIVGGAITYYFSGILMEAVTKSARKMVDEIRRQFKEIVGLREGTAKPDYKRCIEIATNGALSEMRKPAFIAICIPILGGFIGGPYFVAGILIGSILSAIFLAIFCGNCGGSWDNAKKLIESMGLKGTPEHYAAVIGDTVGDAPKDTVGPSLDIKIKIMTTVSMVAQTFFVNFNLLGLFKIF